MDEPASALDPIATAIIEARKEKAITSTGELADIISDAIPVKEKHKHPATRSFQAIRMHINNELQAIEQGLEGAASVLATSHSTVSKKPAFQVTAEVFGSETKNGPALEAKLKEMGEG